MPNTNCPIEKRQHTLNKLVIVAHRWNDTGCQDKLLERQFDSLLNELHPVRRKALDILHKHMSLEVAA